MSTLLLRFIIYLLRKVVSTVMTNYYECTKDIIWKRVHRSKAAVWAVMNEENSSSPLYRTTIMKNADVGVDHRKRKRKITFRVYVIGVKYSVPS